MSVVSLEVNGLKYLGFRLFGFGTCGAMLWLLWFRRPESTNCKQQTSAQRGATGVPSPAQGHAGRDLRVCLVLCAADT